MNVWRSKLVLGGALGALVIFGALSTASGLGWGYAGRGGFHRSPSVFYFGPRTYHGPSVRYGSRYGPGGIGGGMHGGK